MDLNKIYDIIKKKPESNGSKKATDASEKIIIDRMLNRRKLPIDNKTAREILSIVSNKSGVSMPFLAANAFQEGMNKMITKSAGKSNDDFLENIPHDSSEEFPINGYAYYGLDTFGTVAPELIKKGYLPKDFSFDTYGTQNEKKQEVTTANFKSNEDALMAKAAFLKHITDSVRDYATKKNVKLDPKTEEYLTMGGYNGGLGNARLMIDELATGKFNQKDYVEKGLTSRKGVDKNIRPRLNKMKVIDKLTSGPVAPYYNPVPTFDDVLKMVQKR